jgi:hypothetical protein
MLKHNCFSEVPEFELRVLCVLGRPSTTWAAALVLVLAIYFFLVGSGFVCWLIFGGPGVWTWGFMLPRQALPLKSLHQPQGDQDLNSGLFACTVDALLLEPYLQSILHWLFWRLGLLKYLPKVASNHETPDLSLLHC